MAQRKKATATRRAKPRPSGPSVGGALSAKLETHRKIIAELEGTKLEGVDRWTTNMLRYHRRQRDELNALAKTIKRS